jgi:hypothetical protein
MVVEAGAILFDRRNAEKVPGALAFFQEISPSQTGRAAESTMEGSSKCVCYGGAPGKRETERCTELD